MGLSLGYLACRPEHQSYMKVLNTFPSASGQGQRRAAGPISQSYKFALASATCTNVSRALLLTPGPSSSFPMISASYEAAISLFNFLESIPTRNGYSFTSRRLMKVCSEGRYGPKETDGPSKSSRIINSKKIQAPDYWWPFSPQTDN